MRRAGVLTLSDKGASGQREDKSGPVIEGILTGIGISVEITEVIPDEIDLIRHRL